MGTELPPPRFPIRRKILKIFGAAFHVYAPDGSLMAFCKQTALKLREDIRIFTDEDQETHLVSMKARQIIDFGATYDVTLPTGEHMGSLRRKGLKATFLKDSWMIFGPDLGTGEEAAQIATIEEDSTMLALLRRYMDWISIFSPQKFAVRRDDGTLIATFRTHFNPFVYRLTAHLHEDDSEIDELTLLSAGLLIAAIEGRQR